MMLQSQPHYRTAILQMAVVPIPRDEKHTQCSGLRDRGVLLYKECRRIFNTFFYVFFLPCSRNRPRYMAQHKNMRGQETERILPFLSRATKSNTTQNKQNVSPQKLQSVSDIPQKSPEFIPHECVQNIPKKCSQGFEK